jgi:hypothetical protein
VSTGNLLVNQAQLEARRVGYKNVPVMRKMPREITPMYPKYSRYVTNMLPSNLAKYTTEYPNTYRAVDPEVSSERHHHLYIHFPAHAAYTKST